MNDEVNKKKLLKNITTKKAFIILAIAIFLFLIIQVSYYVFINDKVYSGIFINNESVSGLSSEELKKKLTGEYSETLKSTEIVLKNKNGTASIYYADLGVSFDIEKAVQQAHNTGRSGSIGKRIKEIIRAHNQGIHYTMPFASDSLKIAEFTDTFYKKTFVEPTEQLITLHEDKVEITSAKSGEKINKADVINEINLAISKNKSSTIEVPLHKIEMPNKKLEDVFSLIHLEPKNAEVVVKGKTVDVAPEVNGRTIDITTLALTISELNNAEGIVKSLPLTILYPEITQAKLKPNILSNTLSTASTQFYTDNENNANRGVNIRLSVAKLNGTIIAPGESFSFNEVVGERTPANGYKSAHAYSDGKIIDDVGGGICQVSTTLYNALIYADLQITMRINHMFTVGYIPLGLDAAVSYPDVDLRFVNTSSLPIMIVGTVTPDNRVIFSIKGYIDTPGKTIEFYSTITKTYNFTTEYIDDNGLYSDEYYVTQGGMTGYLVDTFKVVRQNGKVMSEEKIYSSYYQPLKQIIVRGTVPRPVETEKEKASE